MKHKKLLAFLLAGGMTASMVGCGSSEPAVYVQSVATLSGVEAVVAGDRFPGMVVAENVTEVQRDGDKTVKELYVKVGDSVTTGQKLFAYDTEDLQLRLDKQRLELEQITATIDNYQAQISELEKEKNKASSSSQLQYTVQIQTLQIDLKEAELNKKNKSDEISQSEAILQNAFVTSPVDGQVQSVKENDDGFGNSAFIVIQQTDSYKVMGKLGELQLGSIHEGVRLKIEDRAAEPQTWFGTVESINFDNPQTGDENNYLYDDTSVTSKYPFYVVLDSTEGLLLGQHVYVSLATAEDEEEEVYPTLNYGFFGYEEDGTTYVWADNNGVLTKRVVTLGEYDMVSDGYQVIEGLSMDDYVAYPDEELCKEGAPTTKEAPVEENSDEWSEGGDPEDGNWVDGVPEGDGGVDDGFDGSFDQNGVVGGFEGEIGGFEGEAGGVEITEVDTNGAEELITEGSDATAATDSAALTDDLIVEE